MRFIHRWSSVAYHTIILSFQVMCISACATHHFYNRSDGSISHSIALYPQILPSPYRTYLPPMPSTSCQKEFQAHNDTPSKFIKATQPYIPPAPAPFCKCPKYCLLVVFHAAMYFSMQFVKVVCSEEEMEEPGLGIARSKQCSLTFCDAKWNCQRIVCAGRLASSRRLG